MNLVIDANILFAVLIIEGKTEELIFHEDINLFAPEFLFEEFNKYSELIIKKTKRTKEELQKVLAILRKRITSIPYIEIEKYNMSAIKICPDPNDIIYFALALKLKCAIWSNDKKLKNQNIIKIYSTEELSNIFRT